MSTIKHLIIIRPSSEIVEKLQLTLLDDNYVQTLPNQVCADIALRNFKYEVKRKVNGNPGFRHAFI